MSFAVFYADAFLAAWCQCIFARLVKQRLCLKLSHPNCTLYTESNEKFTCFIFFNNEVKKKKKLFKKNTPLISDRHVGSWPIALSCADLSECNLNPRSYQLQKKQMPLLAVALSCTGSVIWARLHISPHIKNSQYAQQLHGRGGRMLGMCLQHHNSSVLSHWLIWPGQMGMGH